MDSRLGTSTSSAPAKIVRQPHVLASFRIFAGTWLGVEEQALDIRYSSGYWGRRISYHQEKNKPQEAEGEEGE
jgi:hypothetical protein